jgi:TatD DNase family protein
MFRHDQGCYKCGGFPGHKTKDRPVLYQCTQCGYFVCNQHRIGIGANTCPNCKSQKFKVALSRNTGFNKKTGGLPSSGGYAVSSKWKAKKQDAVEIDPEDAAQNSSGGGGFGAGGQQHKGSKSQGAVMASDQKAQVKVARSEEVLKNPTSVEQVKYVSIQQAAQLPESVRDRYIVQAPFIKDNGGGADMMTLSDTDMESRPHFLVRMGGASTLSENIKDQQAFNSMPLSLADMNEQEKIQNGDFVSLSAKGVAAIDFASQEEIKNNKAHLRLKAAISLDENEDTDDDLPEIAVRMALRAGGSSAMAEDGEDTPLQIAATAASHQHHEDTADTLREEDEPVDDTDPYSGVGTMLDMMDDKKTAIPKMILSDVYFRLTLPESLTKYEEFLKKRAKQQEPTDNLAMAVISFDPRRLALYEHLTKLLREHAYLFGAAGYAPQSVNNLPSTALTDLRRLIKANAKIIAIGDVGLDLHYSPHTADKQADLMVAQIKMAAEFGMPVYLSSKKADDDFAGILNHLQAEGVRFNGVLTSVIETKRMVETIKQHNLYVAIRPEVSYEEAESYRAFLKHVPPAKLLLASGSEHTAPFTHRGWWNEPAFIDETARHAAKVYNVKPEIMATQACKNFARLLFADAPSE